MKSLWGKTHSAVKDGWKDTVSGLNKGKSSIKGLVEDIFEVCLLLTDEMCFFVCLFIEQQLPYSIMMMLQDVEFLSKAVITSSDSMPTSARSQSSKSRQHRSSNGTVYTSSRRGVSIPKVFLPMKKEGYSVIISTTYCNPHKHVVCGCALWCLSIVVYV